MKGAIVILAHSEPKYVKYLESILSTEFDVFIHWDLRLDIPSEFNDCKLIENRNACLWGSFPLWEIQWKSISYVLSKYEYRDITFISESDVPLMPISSIEFQLNSNERSLIQCGDKSGTERGKIADAFIPYGVRYNIAKDKLKDYYGSKYKGRCKDRFSKYVGSQWCTIKSRDFYKMAEYIRYRPGIIDALKCSLIPDEMGFQYLFNQINIPFDDYKRYIEWDGESTHPIPLGWDKVHKIISSGQSDYLFGRKIIHSEIVDNLDELTELIAF